jgi:predicted metal-binding membrane protein
MYRSVASLSSSAEDVAILAFPSAVRSTRPSLVRFIAWHPEWWVYVVAGAAGLLLVVQSIWLMDAAPATGHHIHEGHATAPLSGTSSSAASWFAAWPHWGLMAMAMMLPVVAPQARNVALRSVWVRRQRSASGFVAGYVAVWLVAGAGVLALVATLQVQDHVALLVAGTLLVASAWQVSRPRRRVLRRCAGLRLGAASGFAADLDCARAGLRSGLLCLVTCWPAMLAMALSHNLLLMAGLLTVMLSERARGPNPMRRAGRPIEAWVLVGFALTAAVAVPLQ